MGDGEPFAGGAAGDGGGAQDGVGETGVSRREAGQLHGVARGLLHTVGVGEQRRVPVAHFGLGRAPPLGKTLLDLGEAVGVEEAAEQLAAGLGVRPQEACEVALGQ